MNKNLKNNNMKQDYVKLVTGWAIVFGIFRECLVVAQFNPLQNPKLKRQTTTTKIWLKNQFYQEAKRAIINLFQTGFQKQKKQKQKKTKKLGLLTELFSWKMGGHKNK